MKSILFATLLCSNPVVGWNDSPWWILEGNHPDVQVGIPASGFRLGIDGSTFEIESGSWARKNNWILGGYPSQYQVRWVQESGERLDVSPSELAWHTFKKPLIWKFGPRPTSLRYVMRQATINVTIKTGGVEITKKIHIQAFVSDKI